MCEMAAELGQRRRMSACDVLVLVHRAFWLWERRCDGVASRYFSNGTLAVALLIMASEMEGAAAPCVSHEDFATSGVDARSWVRCKCMMLNDIGKVNGDALDN